MEVEQRLFGYKEGRQVTLYTLKNANGFEVSCMDWGCIITKIIAPDQRGNLENVVLGFDTLEEYGDNPHFLGAVAGRFAGRIKGGTFTLEGQDYKLAANANGHHLHGGNKGFSHKLWKSEMMQNESEAAIEFSYWSPDGEEGYPGNLELKVTYRIRDEANDVIISYSAVSDKTTLLNVTNHSYFNLSGDLKQGIFNHELTINSNKFLELDTEKIPTGRYLPVDDSVFDFRGGRKLQDGIDPQSPLAGGGYDHPFLLDSSQQREIMLVDKESGRQLVVETTEPAVVLYTGNRLGLCLETQGLPDSIHHPHFPSAILKKGERFSSETRYSFGVIDR
ncbi:aldose epimerase family protein [Planococcus shenhongbingii]|uniref:aldose epimerase family protein n=1 Tax=Planococcus shenhongbingii TaxID=3058398 RepID=UPI00261AEB25|nr:aldose epimerase family protein [Planococcus sp. N016]WKA59147.1 aldose epimerase family protein [Planococcus sp. N016]